MRSLLFYFLDLFTKQIYKYPYPNYLGFIQMQIAQSVQQISQITMEFILIIMQS